MDQCILLISYSVLEYAICSYVTVSNLSTIKVVVLQTLHMNILIVLTVPLRYITVISMMYLIDIFVKNCSHLVQV